MGACSLNRQGLGRTAREHQGITTRTSVWTQRHTYTHDLDGHGPPVRSPHEY